MTPPAPAVVRLGRVDSTQTAAWGLAEQGAADGTVVVAETQVAGRGRRGRVWHDEPGASLLASILWYPRLDAPLLPGLSLLAAVAVSETLQAASALAPRLKWPNDVLVGGRKIAGILLESRLGATGPAVVLGIGVNLAQQRFAGALRDTATSVRLETGEAPDRDRMLGVLLDHLGRWRRRLEAEGLAPVRERWMALSDTLGRRVSVDGLSGVAVDLDTDGALVVETAGERWRVVAGEITEDTADAARH